MDLGANWHIASANSSIYDAGFGVDIAVYNNLLQDNVVGISFYRQRRSRVTDNHIVSTSANPLGMWGVLVDHSHNTTLQTNTIRDLRTGIMIRGLPGTLSKLGGSFNCIGS